MIGRRGRRRRKLLDDLKERRGYSHLKEEALYRTVWRAGFGRCFGPVVRQTTKCINEYVRTKAKDNALNLTGRATNVYRTAVHTQLLTYLLTPWSRVLLEKLTGSSASQEIPRIFGTRRFITVLTSARHLSLS